MKEFQEGFVSLKAEAPVQLTGKVLRDRIDARVTLYTAYFELSGWALLAGEVSQQPALFWEINQANNQYGRYQGEIEIAKVELPQDVRQTSSGTYFHLRLPFTALLRDLVFN